MHHRLHLLDGRLGVSYLRGRVLPLLHSCSLVWNFIGAIGFTLCGALGYAADVNSGAEYQSNLSTFWGGWAFLIGSLLQWYESVNSVAMDGESHSAGS